MDRSYLGLIVFVSILTVWLAVGCGKQEPQEQDTDTSYIIDATGIEIARLQQPVASLFIDAFDAASIEDSVISMGGYDWLTRTLRVGEGKVIVEGNFIDSRQVNDTLLSESLVNRIRIESPTFETAEQIHVGSKFEDLTAIFPDSAFYINAIEAYESLQIQVLPDHQINYIVEDKGNQVSQVTGPTEIPVNQVPSEAVIRAIVIMR